MATEQRGPDTSSANPFAAVHALPRAADPPSNIEVVCLGWARTGSQSLKAALVRLGYKVYHMGDNLGKGHDQYWKAGLDALSQGSDERLGKPELDKLLAGYTATCDFPTAAFASTLIEAYPNAKVILNTRPVDDWHASMKSTILHARQTYDPTNDRDAWAAWMRDEFGGDFDANGTEAFIRHEENVKQMVNQKGGDLLVYELKGGWEPLCKFLGKDIPADEFPRKDSWMAYKKDPTWENVMAAIS